MVDCGDHRKCPRNAEEGRHQGLIVVQDVKPSGLPAQPGLQAVAERQQLAECAGIVRQPFRAVGPRQQMSRAQRQEGVFFLEQVERRKLDQVHPLRHIRIGRAGCNRHHMPEIAEPDGEFAQIDTLTANMGM